ncbi:hypothetical protein [Thalassoroseus pseudoceratinae]|uniref:hypothetical protein n=1 Tax=Thalassoroseus pseudoceratinae TaxID=2713176 RepID=UPI0014240E13|nr:hypothetical protein [Thalassoroseus pseudoceratinae]
MIRWDTCRQEFEPDGALRDIYVLDTTIKHWQILFDVLRASYTLEYSVDHTAQPVPLTVDEVFDTRNTASPFLRFYVGGILVACHFFGTTAIEFDISPRDVTSEVALNELLGYLRLVGDTLGKAVIVSHEFDELNPFITYEPSRKEFLFQSVSV